MPTKAELEQQAINDYENYAEKAILLSCVEGYIGDDSISIQLDPPAIAVVDNNSNNRSLIDNLHHWTNDEHLDPYYDVTVVGNDSRLAGIRSTWTWGPCLSTDGKIEAPDFVLAPPDVQTVYGRRITANYVRFSLLKGEAGQERKEEFDRLPFDATGAVLELPLEAIRALEDRSAGAESLAPADSAFRPVGGPRNGGAAVIVVEQILKFFRVDALAKITDDQLEQARVERGMPSMGSAPAP